MAAARLGCDYTYDQLQDLAENHRNLRAIMGLGDYDETEFTWKTIRNNICLLAPETIARISRAIVGAGHELMPDAVEKVRLTARGDFAPLFEGDGLLDVGARELARQIIHESLGTRTTEPPSIARMGFLYIDDDEFDLIVILLVEFFETHGPIAEGRSGITAEYEGNRSFAAKVREANVHVALRIL